MTPYLIIGFVVLIYTLNWLLPKTNTRLGRVLPRSDHAAWQYAVENRERELAELRQQEPPAIAPAPAEMETEKRDGAIR